MGLLFARLAWRLGGARTSCFRNSRCHDYESVCRDPVEQSLVDLELLEEEHGLVDVAVAE